MRAQRFSFEVNRTSAASPATLFRLETDADLWSHWAKPLILSSSWHRRGSPDPAGPGAIRRVGAWPVLMREETLEYEPYHRHVYTIIGQPAVRDYRAEVLFTPNPEGGTDLRWQGSFVEGITGTGPLMHRAMRGAITLLASRLARADERSLR